MHPVGLSRPVDTVGCMVQRPETGSMSCPGERYQGMRFRQTTGGEDVCVYIITSGLRAEYCPEGRLVSEDKGGQMVFSVPSSRSQ